MRKALPPFALGVVRTGKKPADFAVLTDGTSRDSLARNRALTKMLELARTMVADDVVTVEEAEAFEEWGHEPPRSRGGLAQP